MNGGIVKFAAAFAGAVLVSGLLSGCVGIRDHRGAVLDEELVSAVQVGVDNKASVEKTLGRPTLVSQVTPNDWYYVSQDTNTAAFRSPRVREQTVLHVSFDQAGNVAAVRKTGKEQIASINPVNAQTPTLGRRKSFLEEIFGNIGAVGSAPGGLGDPNQR